MVLDPKDTYSAPSEYSGLGSEDPEEYDDIKATSSHRRQDSCMSEQTIFDADSPRSSRLSGDTLRDIVVTPIPRPKQPLLRRILHAAYATLERVLVFAAFGMVLSGIVIYTGGCRDSYINGCLAHLISKIKDSACYYSLPNLPYSQRAEYFGVMGYLPSLASWARTRRWAGRGISHRSETPSLENLWSPLLSSFMDSPTPGWRGLGRNREILTQRSRCNILASRYVHLLLYCLSHRLSTFFKVMFWFAGLVGMGIESRRVRRWLAASATTSLGSAQASRVTEPPSYRASFNPFPALVIGVTGAAMSAHAQAYVFQV